jgi:hypothetical protein
VLVSSASNLEKNKKVQKHFWHALLKLSQPLHAHTSACYVIPLTQFLQHDVANDKYECTVCRQGMICDVSGQTLAAVQVHTHTSHVHESMLL